MARRNIFEMNYAKLEVILGQAPEKIEPAKRYTLRSEGFRDFIVQKISRSETTGATLLSLAHYHRIKGRLCHDPEVIVRVYPPDDEGFKELTPSTDTKLGRMEVIYFQQVSPPVFSAVYPQPGKYNPDLKNSLNNFLAFWLRNLRSQGHTLVDETQDNEAG